MARTSQRPVEESAYLQQRKREWVSRHGIWPLNDRHEEKLAEPPMGTEPDFPEKYERLMALVGDDSGKVGRDTFLSMLQSAKAQWMDRYGPWPVTQR